VRDLRWKGAHAPEDGDWIIAEIPWHGPAHLVEVLGADDRAEWDDAAVASQFRLRVAFPKNALEEAAAWREPEARELKSQNREDRRDDVVVTIDPSDARDHDDALGVRALGGGRHEVGVHIADVGWYVRPGSAIDLEARARGTSCYLPGGAVPMLPERLSGDLCSLREGVDRLALSVFATLDNSGRLHEYRFAATAIRSRARLSYERVQRALDGAEPLGEALQTSISTLMRLARALRSRRLAVGALQLESVEVKAVVDEHGVPLRMERRPHLESHELVEEFMLGLPRLPRQADDPHRALQALLEVPLDPAKRRLVHRMVLRSLARARYLERDLGHFGLATREYLHFTSPIRRYPDLHNHRRVREWIARARDQAWDPHETAALAAECSGREQDATDAEREATRVKGLRLLEGRLGERLSGSITGLVPRGCFVELDDPPVDGFIAVGDQLDDRFELDAAGVRLVGQRTRRRFTLGDTVQVTVARVDVPARECDLALEQDETRRGRHGKPGVRRPARRQGWL